MGVDFGVDMGPTGQSVQQNDFSHKSPVDHLNDLGGGNGPGHPAASGQSVLTKDPMVFIPPDPGRSSTAVAAAMPPPEPKPADGHGGSAMADRISDASTPMSLETAETAKALMLGIGDTTGLYRAQHVIDSSMNAQHAQEDEEKPLDKDQKLPYSDGTPRK